MKKFTYSISSDFPNSKVNTTVLETEIGQSTITIALVSINTVAGNCTIEFKTDLSSAEVDTLDDIVASHTAVAVLPEDAPTLSDGRPIVSANSRPVGYYTMFTMVGDTASGIGDGKELLWDFSNDDDLMASGVAPEGYKGKDIQVSFLDPVYIKEGCLYFFNADKGSYLDFEIICPDGQYYLDRDGNPAQADGDTTIVKYVNKHHFYGDCPMGDELNTESANETPIPSNYNLHVRVYVPEDDNDCYGYGELEIYRSRTILLPGESP